LAEEPPLEIPFESAKEIDNNQKISFPEFEKYEIYEGKTKVVKDPGKLIHAFRYVGKGLGNMKTYFEENEIGSKLKSGGVATLNGISKAGNFLYGKTKEGIGYLYKKISGENRKKNERIIIDGETDDGILYNEDDKEDNIINSNEEEKKNSNSMPINENNNEFKSCLSIMSNKSAAPIDMGTPMHGI
jgi:hypothetical protein